MQPRELATLKQQGKTWAEVGAIAGISEHAARFRVYRLRNEQRSAPAIHIVQPETVDEQRWQDTLHDLRNNKRYITVSHLCDVHAPMQHHTALQLTYRLLEQKQPDVIVVGSDTADFSVISTFDPDPDDYEMVEDALDEFGSHWRPHIDAVKQAAPNATLVFIMGNHEARIYKHVHKNAPKLRRTIERAWVDTVSYGGRVLWLGNVPEVEIGSLLVKHGDRVNEHVAKSLLEVESYQMNVMAGHVHRANTYTRAGRRYTVTGVTSGCLCDLHPKYLKGSRPKLGWTLGTAFAVTDLQGTETFIDNLVYQQTAQGLMVLSDGNLYQEAA